MARLAVDRAVTDIVCLGDMADFDSLCGHIKNDTLEAKTKPSFQRDLESLALAIMTFDENLKSDNPIKKYMTIGNHEHRMWRFENDNPETEGAFTNPYIGLLEHYGWNWCKYGEYIRIDRVSFTHRPLNGMGKPFGGQNAAQAVARETLTDTVFGDSHKLNIATKAKVGGGNELVTVLEAGCALPHGKIKGYAKNSMTGWWWGCHILTLQKGKIAGIESIPMVTLGDIYA